MTFPRPKDPDAGLRAAVTEARKQKKPVEVLSSATENSESWAFPDGHITTDTYAAPARVKQSGGSWSWIDNSLVERDGVLRPRISGAKVAVELSAGGQDHPFASMRVAEKSQELALIWPESLPRPTISGNVATYKDAAATPGADLVVTALTSGFRFDVVLRERPKAPLKFRLPVQAKGLSLGTGADGGLALTDAGGKKVTAGSPPVMWDGGARGGERGSRRTSVDTAVDGGEGRQTLVLTPDARFLADPATRFPVTVDPTITLGVRADTWVENSAVYRDSQYLDTQLWAGGYTDPFSGPYLIDRSFLMFDTSAVSGRAVQSASLALTQNFATGCGDGLSGIKAQRITAAWDEWTLTWHTQPATTTAGEGVARDSARCGTRQTTTWPMTGIVRAWADGAANHGIMLSGVDESASRPDYSRIFDSAEAGGPGIPKLTVSYTLPQKSPPSQQVWRLHPSGRGLPGEEGDRRR
ncbi:DNRLRE domain-containing protein [Streptosporangium sp. NPDC006007]|uniref:DNRLRE domain-containing protein n=1 Tax=Streptosporangium sp. NPDC006007 TaxID=3154575 RepID=UPI0033A203CC